VLAEAVKALAVVLSVLVISKKVKDTTPEWVPL